MNFTEFDKSIQKIYGEKALQIRNKYINIFINIDTERYKNSIAQKVIFEDGLYYKGYLWDCLKSKEVISENEFYKRIMKNNMDLLIFWDLHSSTRILIKDYWKYPRDAVIRLTSKVLLSGLSYLPEDIYVFDDSYLWSLIHTHEDIDGNRYCLKTSSS